MKLNLHNICSGNFPTTRIPESKSYHLEVSESGVVEKPDLLVMEAVK
jgi:hypothetical protein